MALGQIQIKQINQTELTNFVVGIAATGIYVTPGETGNFLDGGDLNETGTLLWNRDWALSGLVNLSTGALYTQLHETGAKIVSLSGDHIALLTRYENEITGVTDISGVTGSINFTGINVDISYSDGWFTFSGNQGGGDVTQAELDSLSGNLVASGGVFESQDLGLSDNIAALSGVTTFSADTGDFLDPTDFTLLDSQDAELSNNIALNSGDILGLSDEVALNSGDILGLSDEVALVSGLAGGWDHASGTLLWNRDDSLSGSLGETGITLFEQDTELSDNIASVSGLIGGGGGSAPADSTKTIERFHATKDYIAPSTGWASPFYGTGYEFLRFRDSTVDGERALYQGVVPEGIDLNIGLNVTLFWHPSTDATDDVAWLTEFKKLESLDNESWGTAITTIDSALGTEESIQSVTAIHSSSEIDSLQTGDSFLLRVTRSGLLGGDTLSDYANLHSIHIQSPVSRTITKTFDEFHAPTFTAPPTGFGQLDYISGVRTLQLHPDSGEAGMYDSIIPENIDLSNGINVTLHWFPEEADTNDVVFLTAFGRRDVIGDDNFGTEKSTTATAGTAGWLQKTYVNHGSSEIGGLESGDFYRLKVGRSGTDGSDTMAGNAQVTYIQLETP